MAKVPPPPCSYVPTPWLLRTSVPTPPPLGGGGGFGQGKPGAQGAENVFQYKCTTGAENFGFPIQMFESLNTVFPSDPYPPGRVVNMEIGPLHVMIIGKHDMAHSSRSSRRTRRACVYRFAFPGVVRKNASPLKNFVE